MAFTNSYQNVCRICLEQYAILLDWNDELLEFCGVTYKDCYFKYTQLEEDVADPYSSMLCESCLTSLKDVHILIEKALASYKILQSRLSSITETQDAKIESMEFEMLLFNSPAQTGVDEDSDESANITSNHKTAKTKSKTQSKLNRQCKELSLPIRSDDERSHSSKFHSSQRTSLDSLSPDSTSNLAKTDQNRSSSEDIPHQYKGNCLDQGKQNQSINKRSKAKNGKNSKNKAESSIKTPPPASTSADDSNDKNNPKKKHGMCSYCSRLIIGIASLKAHEETHKHRERTETCSTCGLKVFDKKRLTAHMKVHAENREKKYKCDFCDKAFFNRGALNIHRRVHLGQMIPCPLCSKQFFRQIDLDKHMNSHSATPINADVKKRSRYYVYCKDCNKSMLSSSWKVHEAVHKNEPLMKCSICDKDFFCRKACVTHMKKVHHKNTRDEYDTFIVSYGKSRLSRLILEQEEKVKPPQ